MPSLAIKLTAILALGLSPLAALPLAGLCLLLAVLDAAQTVPAPVANKRSYWLPEFLAILGQLAKARVWPFYLALWLILGLPQLLSGDAAAPKAGLAASRGWSGSHQPGAGGRCACGKPLGHDKAAGAATGKPAISTEETLKRIEALKQRSMNSAPLMPSVKPAPPAQPPAATVPKAG
jgi:hypothetical protein